MSQFHQLPIRYVSMITIKVKDLIKMTSFYEKTLGFQLLEASPNQVVLGVNNHPIITLDAKQPYRIKGSSLTGLYHVAILLPNQHSLASFIKHVDNQFIIEGASDHGVSEAVYLSDPEANGIEIYVDKPKHEWPYQQGKLQMVTLPLNVKSLFKNPVPLWQGMPQGTVLGHIHLHVDNLQKVESFYANYLGFSLIQRYGTQASFLADGGYHHHIGINTWNGVGASHPTEFMTGLSFFTISIESIQALEKIAESLKKNGIPFEEKGGLLITTDPSGNRVHLKLA